MKVKLFLCFLFLSPLAFSQPDSTYFSSYKKYFTYWGGSQMKVRTFRLNFIDNNEIGNELEYKTNSNINLSGGFIYHSIGFNASVAVPFIDRHNSKYGKTKGLNTHFSFVGSRFVLDTHSGIQKGLYLTNPKVGVFRNSTSQSVFKMKDVRHSYVSMDLFYVFNHRRFTFRSFLNHDVQQLKSAGSLIAGVTASYDDIRNGGLSLLPEEFSDTVSFQFNYHKVKLLNAGGLFGYSQTVVLKNFFANVTFIPGLAYQHSFFYPVHPPPRKKTKNHLVVNLRMKANLGYQSKLFFTGIRGSFRSNATEANVKKGTVLETSEWEFQVYAGTRFRWKWLDRKRERSKFIRFFTR